MWDAFDVVENPSITQREIFIVCRNGRTSMRSTTRSKAPPTTSPFYGRDDAPGSSGNARPDSLEQAQMKVAVAATRARSCGGGEEVYGRLPQWDVRGRHNQSVGEKRAATRLPHPPPPPQQQVHGQGRQRPQFQDQFHRKFPDMNMMQGEGHHLAYLIEAYENGNPFTIEEVHAPPFARSTRSDQALTFMISQHSVVSARQTVMVFI